MINILIEAFGALTIRNGRRDEEEEKLTRMLGKYVYMALGLDKLLPSTKRGIILLISRIPSARRVSQQSSTSQFQLHIHHRKIVHC